MIQARVWLTILCASVAAAACGGEGDGGNDNENNANAGSGSQNTGNAGSGNQNTGSGGSGASSSNGGTQSNGATGGFGTTGSQTGLTPCGNFPDLDDKFCQPGQYCADQTFSDCQNGCLNDSNCASNQTCSKEAAANTGTCQNNAIEISCDDVCDRVLACDPVTPRNVCMQDCGGFNDECKTCLMDVNCNESSDCWEACGLL